MGRVVAIAGKDARYKRGQEERMEVEATLGKRMVLCRGEL